jgi:hypothetical protein
VLHIIWDGGIETMVLFCDGVNESQVAGVEGLAFKIGDGDANGFLGGLIRSRIGALFAVKRIAQKRATNM